MEPEKEPPSNEKYANLSKKRERNWFKVMMHFEVSVLFGVGFFWGLFEAQWKTIFFTLLLTLLANLGQTAGAHRLWAHKSYKASPGLRVFLMLCQTLGGTGTIYEWVKLHRLHHKFYGTDLDPYNPKLGFFYAHFKSFCYDLSPAQEAALKEIDVSDLDKDEVVMFQKKYYWFLFFFITVLLPANAPAEYFGETLMSSFFVACFLRYSLTFHLSLLIHSATKILGLEAGEKYPSDTNMVFILTKTYWLSYHYLAPWDYNTGEYGKYASDWTTKFIRVMKALDYAYDLQTVSSDTVKQALVKSVDEKKPISSCIWELHKQANEHIDNLLIPARFL